MLPAFQNPIHLLVALLIGHAVADFPLQGEFLSRAKNRYAPLPGVSWTSCLLAHAAIHAGAVWVLTGLFPLAALELLLHAVIDDRKCAGWFGFSTDQSFHALSKVLYVALLWWAPTSPLLFWVR